MPTYTYFCDSCKYQFELFAYYKDYQEHPKCEKCNKKTNRHYAEDLITLNASIKKSDNELKTLGDLANRNRDRMSDDQKESLRQKHNEYREKDFDKPLPKGMSRIKKQPKIKWT